jgi:hypothetical protein
VATSASILDLLSADSVAALEMANSANLDLLRAPSTAISLATLYNRYVTCSKGSRDSIDRTCCAIKFITRY